MRGFTFIIAVSFLVPLTSLSAQQPPIEPGSRVRVTAPDCGVSRQATTVEALRGDTLVLAGDPTRNSNPINCPLTSVTRLDVSQGRKSHFAASAGIGVVIGAAGGGIGLAASSLDCGVRMSRKKPALAS